MRLGKYLARCPHTALEAVRSLKWGFRGKIQYLYCHGLMASVARMRHTVFCQISLLSTVCTRAVTSASDCRLSGSLLSATSWQARDYVILAQTPITSKLAQRALDFSAAWLPIYRSNPMVSTRMFRLRLSTFLPIELMGRTHLGRLRASALAAVRSRCCSVSQISQQSTVRALIVAVVVAAVVPGMF